MEIGLLRSEHSEVLMNDFKDEIKSNWHFHLIFVLSEIGLKHQDIINMMLCVSGMGLCENFIVVAHKIFI